MAPTTQIETVTITRPLKVNRQPQWTYSIGVVFQPFVAHAHTRIELKRRNCEDSLRLRFYYPILYPNEKIILGISL